MGVETLERPRARDPAVRKPSQGPAATPKPLSALRIRPIYSENFVKKARRWRQTYLLRRGRRYGVSESAAGLRITGSVFASPTASASPPTTTLAASRPARPA